MGKSFRTLMLAGAAITLLPVAMAQDASGIDFGDDNGIWSNDVECDDPRFEGEGMAEMLDDADTLHDASDCKAAFEAGTITLASGSPSAADGSASSPVPDFGDDNGMFANDGECDDVRFAGPEMTSTGFLDSDIGHDASDCKAAFETGGIYVRGPGDTSMEELLSSDSAASLFEDFDPSAEYDDPPANGILFNGVNFGDDASEWANDDECDDPRFSGGGMTDTTLVAADAYHDATDCLAAWKTGALQLID